MILDEIIKKRIIQLENEKSTIPFDKIKSQALRITTPTKGFKQALSGEKLAVICEVKKASPSKGIIKADFKPVEIASEYEKAGANAISCLTEEFYFQGSSQYLSKIRKAVEIPILRKDFIFDEYQIYEARVIGADALLLIAGVLDTKKISEFIKIANSLNLECLVEVHSEEELETALNANAQIIGINNRNLKTFEVSLEATQRLSALIPKDRKGIIVSESGISSNSDMKLIKQYGATAVLIGETLMRSGDIKDTLSDLRKGV